MTHVAAPGPALVTANVQADPWLWSTGDFDPDRGLTGAIPGPGDLQAESETA